MPQHSLSIRAAPPRCRGRSAQGGRSRSIHRSALVSRTAQARLLGSAHGATARPALPAEADILAALKEHGNRVTLPRRELAALLVRRSGSFTAEEIIAGLPTQGPATVYRNLRLFVNTGILCKTALPGGSPRYSFDGMHHHDHLICVVCGRIDAFRHPAIERTALRRGQPDR